MKTDKMKDAALRKAYGRSCADPKRIEGDQTEVQSAIVELHNEGLVRILHKGNNRGKVTVINYEITPLGTELVDKGGYVKSRRKKRRKTLSKKSCAAIGFMLGAIVTKIIEKAIDLLL